MLNFMTAYGTAIQPVGGPVIGTAANVPRNGDLNGVPRKTLLLFMSVQVTKRQSQRTFPDRSLAFFFMRSHVLHIK